MAASCNGGNNQKWYRTSNGELRTEYSGYCLDVWFGGGNNLIMHGCHNGRNQKFSVPSSVGITVKSPPEYSVITRFTDSSLCVEIASDGNAYMNTCDYGWRQLFKYNSGTQEIQLWNAGSGQDCLDYNTGTNNVATA
ncbi:expressed unknown protein (Partial), partial [Seminavis robusta]|eukprot:Sro4684_g354450.1 n/a (136) ;mRNA; r:2-497